MLEVDNLKQMGTILYIGLCTWAFVENAQEMNLIYEWQILTMGATFDVTKKSICQYESPLGN